MTGTPSMDVVVAYGQALLEDDPDRVGATDALGLDEALMGLFGFQLS